MWVWWDLLVLLTSHIDCCDCRVKIHIQSIGRRTSSKRDSIDDEQLMLRTLLNVTQTCSLRVPSVRTVHTVSSVASLVWGTVEPLMCVQIYLANFTMNKWNPKIKTLRAIDVPLTASTLQGVLTEFWLMSSGVRLHSQISSCLLHAQAD